MKLTAFFISLFFVCIAAVSTAQENRTIIVRADQPVASVQPTMWGVFFEDINMGADGGIYAELVKNRSFEFTKPLTGWSITQDKPSEGSVLVQNRQGNNLSNPRFIRVTVNQAEKGKMSLVNDGFRGMGIKKGLRYDFSMMYRNAGKGIKINLELRDSSKTVIGKTSAMIDNTGNEWQKLTASLNASATEAKANLAIWFEGEGTIDIDMVSLFPEDTWKKRPGGMRADMVQLLADMKPGFIRFPGGCIVEGFDLSQRYQWKKTIGPLDQRQLIINRWNFEFAHRPAPDYFQTFGLGFYEYFQLAEDIGAEPLPILNCGMACQFNTAEVVPLDQLDPYIQDALDLIEFANGDTTTKWGKLRTGMGHAAPFNLKLLGIGNENWGPQYIERLRQFTKAIKAKYPDIRLVNSAGTDPSGDRFDFLNNAFRKDKVDIIAEHYYRRPEWFLQNAGRYDSYDRNGPKIFAGEYAAQSDKVVSIHNKNNLRTAIAEAAFMTGLERNAGVVNMASYAPLFAHVDGWQWTPDMIWVDNLRSFGTPNYYVQKLYATNKGTDVVTALQNGKPLIGQDSLYVSAVIDKGTNELIVKVVNAGSSPAQRVILVEGVKKIAATASQTVLTSNTPEDMNSIDSPGAIIPAIHPIKSNSKKITVALVPYSLNVVRVLMK